MNWTLFGIRGGRFGGLFLSALIAVTSSTLSGDSVPPESLVYKDGSVLTAEVVNIEGDSVVVVDSEGKSETIGMENLSEESRLEVLKWALPLALSGENSFSTRFIRRTESSDSGDVQGGFEVILKNRSLMHLPSDLRLEFVLHRLNFDILWGLDGSGRYTLGETLSDKTEIPFEEIRSGSSKHFTLDSVTFESEDVGTNWSQLIGEGAHSSEKPNNVSKAFLEVRLLLQDEVVGSFYESPAAASVLASGSVGDREMKVVRTPARGSGLEIPLESLVIIDADRATGSGFLAEIRDRTFIVTNAHVIAGARKIECRTTAGHLLDLPGFCFIAEDRDLAMIPISYEGDFMEVAEDAADITAIGDLVTVFGNEAGAAVATELRGQIRGIGPRQVEIDAKIIEGNSGSPVIHEESGKVVGVVAYYIEYEIPEADRPENGSSDDDPSGSESISDEDSSKNIVRRRFAERLDNAKQWERTTFSSLAREGESFEEYQALVIGVAELAREISRNNRIPRGGLDSPDLDLIVRRFHERFDASYRSGSTANRRALDDLRFRIFTVMDAKKKTTDDELSNVYFRGEFDRLNAFSNRVQRYLEGIRVY